MRRTPLTAIPFAVLLLTAPAFAAPPGPLPKLDADPARTSVSGLSSGGFMAVQYATAYSANTIGVGVVAGGPYGCAIWLGLADAEHCMKGTPTGASADWAARWYQGIGAIDPTANIARQRVYLFHGTQDSVVGKASMDAVRDFYARMSVPSPQVAYLDTMAAGHAFVSDDLGNDCPANADPYIVRCVVSGQPYDQPRAILEHVLGAALHPAAATLSASPAPFDQRPYLAPFSGMATTGYAYVPASCRNAGAHCAVHVVFHGCAQAAKYVGDDVYARLGFNEWADTNGLIMLYPQVEKSAAVPFNPMGCWDWWGYTGQTVFATRYGPQLRSIRAMVNRLARR